MQVYCRIKSGIEIDRLLDVIAEFLDSVWALHDDDPQFMSTADLVAIGDAYDSIKAILTRLADARFDYRAYLATPEWWARRDERVRAAGGRCQVCYSDRRLNCHHRTYERIGRELPEDLIVLCEACHSLFHRNGRLARVPRRVSEGLQPPKVS